MVATGAYRVEMRWGMWWLLALFGCALFVGPFAVALDTAGRPGAGAAPWVAGGFAVLVFAAVLVHLVEGARVADAGFILRANAQGLAVRAFPMIAWRSRQEPQEVLESTRAVATWAGAPLTGWNQLVQVPTAIAARQAGIASARTLAGIGALLEVQERLQQEAAGTLRRYAWAGIVLLALAAAGLVYTMARGE